MPDQVRSYIANQFEHHKKMSFQDEFRRIITSDMESKSMSGTCGIRPRSDVILNPDGRPDKSRERREISGCLSIEQGR